MKTTKKEEIKRSLKDERKGIFDSYKAVITHKDNQYLENYHLILGEQIYSLDTSEEADFAFEQEVENIRFDLQILRAISEYAFRLYLCKIFEGNICYFESIYALYNDMSIELTETEPHVSALSERYMDMFHISKVVYEYNVLSLLNNIFKSEGHIRMFKEELKEFLSYNPFIDLSKDIDYAILGTSINQYTGLNQFHDIANLALRTKGESRLLRR